MERTENASGVRGLKKLKPLICRDNVAVFISAIALLVSWLGYRRSKAVPKFALETRSSEEVLREIDSGYTILNAHWIDIGVRNKGSANATNVRVSLWPIHEYSKKPWVGLKPNKDFLQRVDSGVLCISIPVLGRNESVDIDVKSQLEFIEEVTAQVTSKRPISYSQFVINIDCDQGVFIEKTVPVTLRETKAVDYRLPRIKETDKRMDADKK